MYRDLFNHFYCNTLYTKNRSCFMPGDSWILKLLSIVHEVNPSFDCNPTIDVRGLFLDIGIFVKVWHDGLLFKIMWHCRWTIKPLQRLSSGAPTEISFSWLEFFLGSDKMCCSTKFSSWPFFVLNTYKWLKRRP